MRYLRGVLVVLALVLLAAHLSRADRNALAGLVLLLPFLLFVRAPWAGWTLRTVLFVGGLEWIRTLFRLVGLRRSVGEDWARLAVILLAVAAVTFAAAKAVRIAGRGESPRPGPASGGGDGGSAGSGRSA
jgi:hypothetical protein